MLKVKKASVLLWGVDSKLSAISILLLKQSIYTLTVFVDFEYAFISYAGLFFIKKYRGVFSTLPNV